MLSCRGSQGCSNALVLTRGTNRPRYVFAAVCVEWGSGSNAGRYNVAILEECQARVVRRENGRPAPASSTTLHIGAEACPPMKQDQCWILPRSGPSGDLSKSVTDVASAIFCVFLLYTSIDGTLNNKPYNMQALLALQTMQELVATAGKHLRPHLAVVLLALVPRLGDHKVWGENCSA